MRSIVAPECTQSVVDGGGANFLLAQDDFATPNFLENFVNFYFIL
jgi:hypothetical protein